MRLVPVSQNDSSWSKIKAEWKAAAERSGRDFTTFVFGAFTILEPLSLDSKSGLHGFYEEEEARALCQISRLLVGRHAGPVVRVRFVTVSPLYDSGFFATDG